ncbi:MAG: inositol monophosphatase family protein [Anaerolineae bacterium]
MSGEETHLLETAIRAARAGGQLARSRLGNPGYQKWKGPRDLLAGAVLEVQARIGEVIHQAFPDHHLLVEETEAPQDEQADPLWIIDPLDGSLNFFYGIPLFAICVGYRAAGRYRVGVVYDPCRDELFQAVLGGGAYLNGQPIHVDQFADGQDAFQAAVVGTDWTGGQDEVKRAFQLARFIAGEVLHIRVLGSPALGLCYVAAGRLHAYYGLDHLKLWDVAAAAVILEEAGGTLTDIDGGLWPYAEEGYLATNSVIHRSMLGVISGIRKLQRQSAALRQRD